MSGDAVRTDRGRAAPSIVPDDSPCCASRYPQPAAGGRDRVVASRVKRLAAHQPTQCQPAAARCTVLFQGAQGVGAAGGDEAAVCGHQRRDKQAIGADRRREQPAGRAHRGTRGRVAAASARSRSTASEALLAVPADAPARMTSIEPAGSADTRLRSKWRRRRAVRERTTEPPTPLPTIKPARAGTGAPLPKSVPLAEGSTPSTWTVSSGLDARRPRRTARPKSAARRSRCSGESTCADVTTAWSRRPVRPTAPCGPCADGRPGLLGPRGSASAAENRGSSPVGGCSAGRCACSLRFSWRWEPPDPRGRDGGAACCPEAAWCAGAKLASDSKDSMSLRTAQGEVKHARDHLPPSGLVSLWTTLAGRVSVLLASNPLLPARRGAGRGPVVAPDDPARRAHPPCCGSHHHHVQWSNHCM